MPTAVDIETFPTESDDPDDAVHPLATEDKSSILFSCVLNNGVIWGRDTELYASSNATGMNVTVEPGICWIDGFVGRLTENVTLDIASAHPTAPRVDRVVARLDVTSPATISLVVLTGTPALEAETPPLEDTDIPIAYVYVHAGVSTITSENCGRERLMTGRLPERSYSASVTEVNGNINVTGTADVSALYTVVGMTCFFQFSATVGIDAYSSGGGMAISLPLYPKYDGIPIKADVHNNLARGFTSHVLAGGYATAYPLQGASWDPDSVFKPVLLRGDYEIARR